MKEEPVPPEPEAFPAPPASPAPLDIAVVHANVSSLRADMGDVKLQLSALKAQAAALADGLTGKMAETTGSMTGVLTDVVRLEQRCERMAASLSQTQEDVRKILLLMATKHDVERVLSALEAAANKPP